MSIKITQATPADLDQLVNLFDGYRRFYEQPSDPEGARTFLAERLQRGESIVFLAIDDAEDERESLGFVQLFPSFSSVSMKRLWILNDLYVAPDARQRGVARALMEAAHKLALQTGAKGLTLQTAHDNTHARTLYESLGYEQEVHFVTYDLLASRTPQP